MIYAEDLGVPPELEQRFERWIWKYDDAHDPSSHRLPLERKPEINAEGEALAKELKGLLPDTYIEYWGEAKKGIYKKEITGV